MNTRWDMPENYYFGGGGESFATPIAVCLLAVGMVALLLTPRRYLIAPLLVVGVLVPFNVQLVVLGLHFQGYRLLMLAGLLRYFLRRDFGSVRFNLLDKVVVSWACVTAVMFCLLWRESAAVVKEAGFLYTTLAAYFLVRLMIRTKDDVLLCASTIAVLLAVLGPLFYYEHWSGHNPFAALGAAELSSIRDGAVRAQGPFAHPIIAGTVAATAVPLLLGSWWQGRRALASLGIVGALTMVVTAASSTPVLTVAAGIFALLLWPARKDMRVFRWALLAGIVGLHLVMKAPVWFLIARASGLIGGSGWHRAMLIDNFVRRIGDWWLVGTRNNADWGYDMWDAVNAYVSAGQNGGLLAFGFYLAVFVYAYKAIGNARRTVEAAGQTADAHLIWALGAALAANTVAFFGIAYFDQSVLLWFALLAMISASLNFATEIRGRRSCRCVPHLHDVFRRDGFRRR